jgi:hypothetical protein
MPLLLIVAAAEPLSDSACCSAATLRIVYSADMSGTGLIAVKLLRCSFLPPIDLRLSGSPFGKLPLLLPSLPVGVLHSAAAAEGVRGPACTLLLLLCRRLHESATALLALQAQKCMTLLVESALGSVKRE